MNSSVIAFLQTTDFPAQNYQFEQLISPHAQNLILLELDPAAATVHTIDAWPAIEHNGVAVLVAGIPISQEKCYQVVYQVLRKDPEAAATGNVVVAIVDLPGEGSNTLTDAGIHAVNHLHPVNAEATSSITVTFSASDINLKVRLGIVGRPSGGVDT